MSKDGAGAEIWKKVLESEKDPVPTSKLPDFQEYQKKVSGEEASATDQTAWIAVFLGTLTLHLKDIQTIDQDGSLSFSDLNTWDDALLMVPFAPWLVCPHPDLNAFIAELTRIAFNMYKASERGQQLAMIGELKTGIGNHKKQEFELGGHRYVISACDSDRPAAVVKFQAADEVGTKRTLKYSIFIQPWVCRSSIHIRLHV